MIQGARTSHLALSALLRGSCLGARQVLPPSMGVPLLVRGFAGDGEAARQRALYDLEVSKMRKKFAEESDKQIAAAEAKLAALRATKDAAVQNRKAGEASSQKQSVQVASEEAKQMAAMHAEERAERAGRREMREKALQVARVRREEGLLEKSSSWVRQEDLDERIREALDKPHALR